MKSLIFVFFIFSGGLFASKVVIPKQEPDVENPWVTGPLIAPASIVVPGGDVNYEPYFTTVANTGIYDRHGKVLKSDTFWTNSFQPFVEIGLTSWMDFEVAPSVSYNYTQHQAQWVFGDFPVILNIQLFAPDKTQRLAPYVKLQLTEIFPTGKYQNLDPKKLGVDSGGTGSFRSNIGLVVGKLVRLWGSHFITPRIYLQYQLPSAVHLKGFNAYGGGYGTFAKFFPAQNFLADFGIEFSLDQRWSLACDFVGTWALKTHFSGEAGKTANGSQAILGRGFSTQYALAPALEYNWSDFLGVIGGGWFTVAGRNSDRFWSSVFAINYYH